MPRWHSARKDTVGTLDTLPQDPTSKYVLTHSFHDHCDGNGNGVSDSALTVACGKPKPLNPTLPSAIYPKLSCGSRVLAEVTSFLALFLIVGIGPGLSAWCNVGAFIFRIGYWGFLILSIVQHTPKPYSFVRVKAALGSRL